MKRQIFALAALLLGAVLPVHAASVTFILGDHPDAALFKAGGDPYGLRLDDQPPPGNGPTWSAGTNLGGLGGPVTLTWDPANLAAGATITGTMVRDDDNTSWTVSYTLGGLFAAEGNGFKATTASGTLNEIGGALRMITLNGESNGTEMFEFDDDGHRLGGGSDWVGRGWLLPAGSTDDWLVTAQVIPVPAAAWLFGSALGLLGWSRRRRS